MSKKHVKKNTTSTHEIVNEASIQKRFAQSFDGFSCLGALVWGRVSCRDMKPFKRLVGLVYSVWNFDDGFFCWMIFVGWEITINQWFVGRLQFDNLIYHQKTGEEWISCPEICLFKMLQNLGEKQNGKWHAIRQSSKGTVIDLDLFSWWCFTFYHS